MNPIFSARWTAKDEARLQQILAEAEKQDTNEERFADDGPDADGEIARERYYDAQACMREWRTPPQYR